MIEIDKDNCDFCGTCVAVCPEDCIELFDKDIHIENNICTDCNLCVFVCPIEVLSQVQNAKI